MAVGAERQSDERLAWLHTAAVTGLSHTRLTATNMQWVEDKVRSILSPFVDSDLELSIWHGDCTLRHCQLRVEALDDLKLELPCKVLGAYIDKLAISLSWRTLISVTVDQVYVVAAGLSELEDSADAETNENEHEEKQRKVKRAVIDAWQVMQDKFKAPGSLGERATLVDRLASWVISRVSIDVRNVHLRLEEALSELTTPAAGVGDKYRGAVEPRLELGIVLRGLSLNEMRADEVISGRLRRESPQDGGEALGAAAVGLRLDVSGLAVYTRVEDAPREQEDAPWHGGQAGEPHPKRTRKSVEEVIAYSIVAEAVRGMETTETDASRKAAQWVSHMQPMVDSGVVDAHILRPSSLRVSVRAKLRGVLKGTQVAAEISVGEDGLRIGARHAQLLSLLALGEALSFKARRHAHRECKRPSSPPGSSPREWWHYVGRCGLLTQRNARVAAEANRLSWAGFSRRRQQRLEYVRAFVDADPMLRKKFKAGQTVPEPVATLFEHEQAMQLPTIFTYRALAAQVLYQRFTWRSKLKGWTGVGAAPEPVEEADLQQAIDALDEEANAQAKMAKQCAADFVQVTTRERAPVALSRLTMAQSCLLTSFMPLMLLILCSLTSPFQFVRRRA